MPRVFASSVSLLPCRPDAVLRAAGALACLLALALSPAAVAVADSDDDAPLRIAVAASFRAAVEAIAADYVASVAGGEQFRFSSAASGVLAAQLRQGAPFDLFLAADQARPQLLLEAGIGEAPPRCYARGGLVLLGAKDLHAALADRNLAVAIANPRSAPYGAAAIEVLDREGFAGPATRRVVRGANVQQAVQYFDSGAADLALVGASVAPGRGIAVPASWHAPILQFALVIAGGERAGRARAFLDYLLAAQRRPRLREFGFDACP